MALVVFPSDVAHELKSYAEKASSHCAKVRFGKKGEADAAKIDADQHYDRFQEKSEGLLSHNSCENIKWVLWRTAWYAPNTRIGDYGAAEQDKQSVEEHCKEVIKEGEVSETLLTNVKKMGWDATWFATNTIVGYHDDAMRDKANVEQWFAKMKGEITLVAMNFIMDEAKILSEEPKTVAEETLVNNGDIQQTMPFTFSVSQGKTSSTSHKIAFSYGVKTSFSAGFSGFADRGYEISFDFSHDRTFSESINTGTTKSYEFPLSVPAHNTYVARVMVHEAQMEVPYELVFDFSGGRRSVNGIWKGVAVNRPIYQVDKKQWKMFITTKYVVGKKDDVSSVSTLTEQTRLNVYRFNVICNNSVITKSKSTVV